MHTLSLGPKNAVLGNLRKKNVLLKLVALLNFCKDREISEAIITDINVKTITYIKNCKKHKYSRNVHLTQRYLKDNKLFAVPFDNGIGISIMKVETYQEKFDYILMLPQFQKLIPKWKNEKHRVMKEEERIIGVLKQLKEQENISQVLFDKLKPINSQPPGLYGLAKIHKEDVPLRPVLSMPGSAYHKIVVQVTE